MTRRADRGLGKTSAGGSGGSFAAHDRAAAAPPTVASRPELPKLSQEALETLNEGEVHKEVFNVMRDHVEAGETDRQLVYVSYDDQLRADQIDQYLAGGEQSDELHYDIGDSFTEERYVQSESEAKQLLVSLGVDEDAAESLVEVDDTLGEVIRDYDTSDVVADLARNTHPQLMRVPVGDSFADGFRDWTEKNGVEYDALYDGNHDESTEARSRYITDHLKQAGFDPEQMTDEDRTEIESLATEGPYYWHEGVRLDVIWQGSIDDAALPDGSDQHTRAMTFGGAPANSRHNQDGKVNVVLLDPMNGSGYDASLSQPLTVEVSTQSPARLDSGGSSYGYGWDDTAGVVHSYYDVGVSEARD